MNLGVIIILLLMNFFILKNYYLISKFFNIYDLPNNRKIHNVKTPLIGGVIFFINLIFFLIFFEFETNYYNQKYNLFLEKREIYLYFVFSSIIFLIGLIDDKIDLNPYLKLFFLGLSIFIFLILCKSALITELNFSFLKHQFILANILIFFPLCVFYYLLILVTCSMV